MPSSSGNRLHYLVAILWLATTVSMVSWWLAMGLNIRAMQRMYAWEGATLITLLVAGGVAMVLAIRREHLRRAALETFFLSFTHDLKTSLASVQLQAEGLREDWPPNVPHDSLDRLLHDTVRLQIQLENSLFVAQPTGRLLVERVDVARAIERAAHDWPDLACHVDGAATVRADARAVDAVLRNVFQNAVIHGGARTIRVALTRPTPDTVQIRIVDDGRGVAPERVATLGQPVAQPGMKKGSGVGLFVSGQLLARMHGAITFGRPSGGGSGFAVEILLPGDR